MSLADEIRKFVFDEFINPALTEERAAIVRVGDVHRRMGFKNRVPAIVSAIGGRIFCAEFGLVITDRQGRPVSTPTTFVYEPSDGTGLLPSQHLASLKWFEERTGKTVAWTELNDRAPQLATQAKGIYKPSSSRYALSIKIIPEGRYPDDKPYLRDGKLVFRYHQEEPAGKNPEQYFTNIGLKACKDDDIPVGVIRRTEGGQQVFYEILGLGRVLDWVDGYFTIELQHGATEAETPPDNGVVNHPIPVAAAPSQMTTLRVKDITDRIPFSDQVYGRGSEAAPVLTFARNSNASVSYTKTAVKKVDWKNDYIVQYVPYSAPRPRNEHLVGKLVSLVSIYPKEGTTREFLDPHKDVSWDVDRWPDAIMLREVFWFTDPPELRSLVSEDEYHLMTSHSRNRLGAPPQSLFNAIKDLEIRPVLDLYRSPSALKYLAENIEPNPTLQVVANRRTGKAGYVYALELPEYPGFLKIGSAFDPSYRVRGLSTAVPSDFTIVDAILFDDCRKAEKDLHDLLTRSRHRPDREWFRATPQDFKAAASTLRSALAPSLVE